MNLSGRILFGLLTAGVMILTGPGVAAQESGTKEAAAGFDEVARRARAAREGNSLSEAIELYRQAVQLRPSWAEGWWYLGTLLYDLDRYEEGRDAFRRMAVLEPKSGPAWALLGLCEFQTREYRRALEDIEKGRSLGLSGNDQLTYVSRYHAAILMTRFEKFEGAFAILFALAREHFDNPMIVEALGLSVLRMPFLPAELPPDRREMVLKAGRAAAYTAAHRIDDARREYESLQERYPDAPNVNYAYGVFLLSGDPDRGLEHLKRELEISPSHLAARIQIAFEYVKRGDYQAALPFAREAVELDPGSFASHHALGRALLETGNVEAAIRALETAVKLAPDSPETRFVLAKAYSRAGRNQDAAREREEFMRLDKMRRQRTEAVPASEPRP